MRIRGNIPFFVLTLFLVTLGTSCSSIAYRAKEAEGAKIIEKVGRFKDQEGRLPRSLTEMGIAETEEGPVYYKQVDENRYQLWYGTSLGESVTYDSDRRMWK